MDLNGGRETHADKEELQKIATHFSNGRRDIVENFIFRHLCAIEIAHCAQENLQRINVIEDSVTVEYRSEKQILCLN